MAKELDNHLIAYDGKSQYDFDNTIILNWYPRRIVRHTGSARSVLELGLGHGYTTQILSRHFAGHTVLEGSRAIIERFKRLSPENTARIVETYFETYETGERYDVIVMGFILEHVDDPLGILVKYRNYLNPGGRVYIAVPNSEVLNRRLGYIAGMMPSMDMLSENDRNLGHKRYYTVSSLKDEAERAGFTVGWMEGIYLKPFTTGQMLALNLGEEVINALCVVGIDYPELSCGILAELRVAE